MKPIPIINVNLNKYCEDGIHCRHAGWHEPLPIPCPIPPSVTFTVRLGECTCPVDLDADGDQMHAGACPARPIRASCSISGKTWSGSEVTDVDPSRGPDGFRIQFREAEALAACRALWAAVKALVTGVKPDFEGGAWTGSTLPLFEQRDAVFAALAEMARAEQAAFEAQERATKALGETTFLPDNFHRAEPERRPAAGLLERYVERLIEQVGILEGGQ